MPNRTLLIAGNWKMNNDVAEAAKLADELAQALPEVPAGVEVLVCPPTIDITTVHDRIQAAPIALGAQNVYWEAKGAFTGAVESKGLLELADHGTLFLDELNSMPIYLQSKLLRVLQDGTFRSIGSTEVKRSDLKIIAALNQDPIREIACGHLRQDIYYRLSIMSILSPPLRERKEDIQSFVETLIKRHNKTFQKQIRYVSHELIQRLQAYDWPGNVRELEHIIVYGMSVVSGQADTLTFADVEKKFTQLSKTFSSTEKILSMPLNQAVDGYERDLIHRALFQSKGNVSEAAKVLCIPRQTLQRKIKQHGLDPATFQG